MDTDDKIANARVGESAISQEEHGSCTRCGKQPRVPGQRWCKHCRAAWKREQRHRQKTTAVPRASATNASPISLTLPLDAPATGNTPTDRARGPDPQEVHQACEAYQAAVAEYERTRSRNWYRSPDPPGIVLGPLWSRVEAAKRRLTALGIDPSGEQSLVTREHQLKRTL